MVHTSNHPNTSPMAWSQSNGDKGRKDLKHMLAKVPLSVERSKDDRVSSKCGCPEHGLRPRPVINHTYGRGPHDWLSLTPFNSMTYWQCFKNSALRPIHTRFMKPGSQQSHCSQCWVWRLLPYLTSHTVGWLL